MGASTWLKYTDRLVPFGEMGKEKRRSTHRRNSPLVQHAAESESTRRMAQPLLQKMKNANALDRELACVSVSNLIRNSPRISELYRSWSFDGTTFVKLLISRISDSVRPVRIAALCAVRSFLAVGKDAAMDDALKSDILTNLLSTLVGALAAESAFLVQEPNLEGLVVGWERPSDVPLMKTPDWIETSELLLQCVLVVYELCVARPWVAEAVTSTPNVVVGLVSFATSRVALTLDVRGTMSAAMLLNVLSEGNDTFNSLFKSGGQELVDLVNSVLTGWSDSGQIGIAARAHVLGMILNLLFVEQGSSIASVQDQFVGLLANPFTLALQNGVSLAFLVDIVSFDVGAFFLANEEVLSKAVKSEECSPGDDSLSSTAVVDGEGNLLLETVLQTWEERMQAMNVAFELVTNLFSFTDEDSADDDFCVSSGTAEVLATSGLVHQLLSLCDPMYLSEHTSTVRVVGSLRLRDADDNAETISSSLVTMCSRSICCLSNILGSMPVESLGLDVSATWCGISGMIRTGEVGAVVMDQRSAFLSRCLLGVVRQHPGFCPPQSDVEWLVNGISSLLSSGTDRDVEMILVCLSILLACFERFVVSYEPSFVRSIASLFCSVLRTDSLPLIEEVLNGIFDLFGVDNANVADVFDSTRLMDVLVPLPGHVRKLLRAGRTEADQAIVARFSDVLVNLSSFISYVKGLSKVR